MASRQEKRVLLVIVGVLGDWCIRRVLAHAIEFGNTLEDKVRIVVVDIQPRRDSASKRPAGESWGADAYTTWIKELDRWIVRRLIEQSAEDLDPPLRDAKGRATKSIDCGFTEQLAKNPELPDPTAPDRPNADEAIAKFVGQFGPVFSAAYHCASEKDLPILRNEVAKRIDGYLRSLESSQDAQKLRDRWGFKEQFGTLADFKTVLTEHLVGQILGLGDKIRSRLVEERTKHKEWLQGSIELDGIRIHRYWLSEAGPEGTILWRCRDDRVGNSTPERVDDEMLSSLSDNYRIVVYVATPPDVYPGVLRVWSRYAERIALEKPVAGLVEEDDEQ